MAAPARAGGDENAPPGRADLLGKRPRETLFAYFSADRAADDDPIEEADEEEAPPATRKAQQHPASLAWCARRRRRRRCRALPLYLCGIHLPHSPTLLLSSAGTRCTCS